MATNLYNQLNNQTQSQFQIDPQIQAMLKAVKESNMSAKDLFYLKAKEMGVDPESILKQLR